VEVEDNGDVWVSAPSRAAAKAARDLVLALVTPVETGAVFRCAGWVCVGGGGWGGGMVGFEGVGCETAPGLGVVGVWFM